MRWIWLAPAGALAFAAFELRELMRDLGSLSSPLLLIVFGVLAALCAGALLLVARAVVRRRPGQVMVALALTFGFQAATPVEARWHDGCNGHAGDIAAIAMPYIWLTEPEMPYVPYAHGGTDIGCD